LWRCKGVSDKLLTLEDVLRLLNVKELPVEPKMIDHVIQWTNELVQEYGEDWIIQNRGRLVIELEEM
jgi:hypothetical protein